MNKRQNMSQFVSIDKPSPRNSELRRFIRVMSGRWVVTAGAIVILICVISAIFAPFITPYDPIKQNLKDALAQPSASHLLGTDDLGRDLLSRIIFGSRISLLVGVVAVAIAGVIGMTLGLLAGYLGGWVYSVIMRFTDALLSFPPLILMLSIAAILGGGLINVLIAIGIGMMPTYCRLMCGQVLAIKQNDYITASLASGANSLRIMTRHILPNSFAPLLVLITMNFGTAILMEASLSFLGAGVGPPTPTWGGMVNAGYRYLISNPFFSFSPGIAILLVVLAFNMVGDGLRDALDPRLRGRI
jgi:peptide/nickel transport system permease protein